MALDLEPTLIAATVEQAHVAGLRVATRVDSVEGAREAIELGIDDLHGPFVADDALLDTMLSTTWTPNLTLASVTGVPMGPLLDTVGRAHARGVTVQAGSAFPASDGSRLGDDLFRELGWLAQAMPIEDVLAAATVPLESGDLVWFSADLREGVPKPADVRQVWKAGTKQLGPEAPRKQFRRTNVVPQGYFYWEPVLTGVLGAGFTAFDVANTGTVAVVDVQFSFLGQFGADVHLSTPSFIPRTSLEFGLHYDGFDALWYGRGADTQDADDVRYNEPVRRDSGRSGALGEPERVSRPAN